jgi:hypothetical protein
MDHKPIARCEANGVDAYRYPFYVKPARGMEPAYIFLEDHVYNFTAEEAEVIVPDLIRIEDEKDLDALGFKRNDVGIYLVSPLEEPWLRRGEHD